jgi:hypothetical protein
MPHGICCGSAKAVKKLLPAQHVGLGLAQSVGGRASDGVQAPDVGEPKQRIDATERRPRGRPRRERLHVYGSSGIRFRKRAIGGGRNEDGDGMPRGEPTHLL